MPSMFSSARKTPCHRLRVTALSILSILLCTLGHAQSLAPSSQSLAVSGACVAPMDLKTSHLYGQWEGEFFELPSALNAITPPTSAALLRATLVFERHPEHASSLRGTLTLNGGSAPSKVTAWLSGDVDAGELILDESDDGQRISAVWVGTAVDGACGREIRGTRRLAGEDTANLYVLKKTAGWR